MNPKSKDPAIDFMKPRKTKSKLAVRKQSFQPQQALSRNLFPG